jgi:integrase
LSKEGIYKNLCTQIDRIYRQTNEKSFKTRARYLEATYRFCEFLSEKYPMQNFASVRSKHLKAYVEQMKAKGQSASTIKTDISGIRFFHERCGSKYRLCKNENLNLPKRESNPKINKAWTKEEIENAKMYALQCSGQKVDGKAVYLAISLGEKFGARLEEACRVEVNHVKEALRDGSLYIKGKGGLVRYVPVRTAEQRQTLRELLAYAQSNKLTGGEKIIPSFNSKNSVKETKKSIQNWIARNLGHFQDTSRERMAKDEKVKAELLAVGVKPPKDTLSFHGLRHTYCQTRIKELETDSILTKREIDLKVSKELGHHRAAVTRIYMGQF